MKKKIALVVVVLLCVSAIALSKEGKASYYHDKFHGRVTASGTIFNQNELTCAHKTLPFGTTLLVTNLRNNKQVKVTVTDRGPFIKGRHVDLSKSAAQQIDMVGAGVQKIDFTIIGKRPIIKRERTTRKLSVYIKRPVKEKVDIDYLYSFENNLYLKRVEIITSKPETLNLFATL